MKPRRPISGTKEWAVENVNCILGCSHNCRWIEAGQTDDAVRAVFDSLAGDPLIRWKESYKQVLGLATAMSAGEDK